VLQILKISWYFILCNAKIQIGTIGYDELEF
jgi:hypothetical protein